MVNVAVTQSQVKAAVALYNMLSQLQEVMPSPCEGFRQTDMVTARLNAKDCSHQCILTAA